MAFWGVEVKPGKPYSHHYDEAKGRLRISQATLGNEVGGVKSGKTSPKTVLQCNVGDKSPVLLCSLFTNTSETCNLTFEFEEPEEEVIFFVLGQRSIHLSGFYLGSGGGYDGSEDAYGEDIADTESEDSEIGLFSDEENDSYDSEFIDDDGDIGMLSSPPRKSGVVIEEILEEEKPSNGEKSGLAVVKKNDDSALATQLDSEDEDGFPVSKKTEEGKKRKNDDSTPETDAALKKKKKLNKKNKKGKKENAPLDESEDKKAMNDSEKSEEEKNDVPVEAEMKEPESAAAGEASEKEGKKKKKKKKNKKAENDSSNKKEKENDEEKQAQKNRTFSNGLIIEEISMGRPDGKRANPGSKVSVKYIGKLKNGKIFDSNVGPRPFKFRLGIGAVIKGWDVGVNGMRVGDKRRLTIPPSMGYGDQKAGEIPKNSWLIFDVELVDVN